MSRSSRINKDLERALAKKGIFWLGDTLEDDDEKQWEIVNLRYEHAEDQLEYEISRTSKLNKSKWVRESHLNLDFDLIDMADRPGYNVSVSQEWDEDPKSRLEELEKADAVYENLHK